MFVRKTRSNPIAVPISDMGTGEVRGSSAAGSLAMQKAHVENARQMGATEARMVENRQVCATRSQRRHGESPVYPDQVSWVKSRVKDGSPEYRPDTLNFGLRPCARQSERCRTTWRPWVGRSSRTREAWTGN